MAEGKDIGIHIKTTADTSGVDKADDSIKQLKKTTAADIEAMTDKVKVAQWGFYDLDSEIRKTAKSSESFTSGVTKMEKPTRDNAAALLAFSQGFEDAQFGIRGVLNNIPSLIFAMGGGAGLAGAISVAAVAGSQLFDMLTKTAEKSSVVADRIKAIADNMGADELDRFEAVGDAISFAADSAEALRQNWTETQKAEADYSKEALSNAEKLAKAQILIAESLGLQVDRFKELETIAEREAEQRKLQAEQAVASLEARLELSKQEVTTKADILGAETRRAASEEANLVNARAKLQALRDERAELEKIGKLVVNAPIGAQFGATLSAEQVAQNNEARDARKKLQDPAFKAELEGAQARVDKLEEAFATLTRDGGVLDRTQLALDAANTKLADDSAAIALEIQKVQESAATDDILARSQALAATGEQFAKQLVDTFGKIETTNAEGIVAKDTIGRAAEDGRITLKETADVAEATRTLIGQVQSGIATTGTNIQDLLRLQTAFVASQESIADRVKALEARINQINQRQ
jgi:hypothetical protein